MVMAAQGSSIFPCQPQLCLPASSMALCLTGAERGQSVHTSCGQERMAWPVCARSASGLPEPHWWSSAVRAIPCCALRLALPLGHEDVPSLVPRALRERGGQVLASSWLLCQHISGSLVQGHQGAQGLVVMVVVRSHSEVRPCSFL